MRRSEMLGVVVCQGVGSIPTHPYNWAVRGGWGGLGGREVPGQRTARHGTVRAGRVGMIHDVVAIGDRYLETGRTERYCAVREPSTATWDLTTPSVRWR